eukprot:Rmarinus@m.702
MSDEGHVNASWEHFRQLGNPVYMCAPMVNQSELAFRELCRRYNTDLCYTPMLHARMFLENENYRKEFFTTHAGDRPLVVQFCANNPDIALASAKLVQDKCDAIDLNLGCPQGIAKRGRYGAFLMDDVDHVCKIVRTLKEGLDVPVWCKIRVFPDVKDTISYAKRIQEAGCSVLAVHGRTRDMKGINTGVADLTQVKAVKEALSIPVLSNGNIRNLDEAKHALALTGADGVLSAEGLLDNPALFSGLEVSRTLLAKEYMEIESVYNNYGIKIARTHMFGMLGPLLKQHVDLCADLHRSRSKQELLDVINQLHERVEKGISCLDPSIGLPPCKQCNVNPRNEGHSLCIQCYRALGKARKEEDKGLISLCVCEEGEEEEGLFTLLE